jgi:2-haloacid dehalogenase
MAPLLRDIQACVFDAYGTLFDVHSPAARIAGELGDKAKSLSDLWRQKQLQYTWLRSLMHAHADFWQVTGEALDFALAAHRIDDRALREKLMQLYLRLDAYDDALETLRTLRAGGFATAILSNGSPSMLRAAVENSGLAPHVDPVLSIEEAGIYKPDPAVYRLACDRLRIEPGAVCFVSANAWDAAGAAHFGFQVVHLNRFGQPREGLPGVPKAVVAGLADLPPLLL